jgi:hypothetical protein
MEGAMTFQGAVIREQRVTFAVVVVKKHALDSGTGAGRAIAAFQPAFPGLPGVLMAQDAGARRPTTIAVTSLGSWLGCPSKRSPGSGTPSDRAGRLPARNDPVWFKRGGWRRLKGEAR